MAHGINTTVVELDPVVYKFAANYFNFPASQNVVIEDAIAFVEKSNAAGKDRWKYDYIIHDVFTGGAEPIELFTEEFLQGLSEMLTAEGVIAIVSAFGELSLFGEDTDNIRIMLGICCVRQPATLSALSSPSSQHVGSIVRMQSPWVLGRKNRQGISPTWSSFAGNRVTVSTSKFR